MKKQNITLLLKGQTKSGKTSKKKYSDITGLGQCTASYIRLLKA